MFMIKAYNFSNSRVNNFRFLTGNNQGYKLVAMNMADRIKQRMQELDIKQDDLAKQAGLTQPAIFKLLSGKTRRTTRLTEIAKALGVRPEWLVEGIEPKFPAIEANDQEFLAAYHTLPSQEQAAVRTLVFRGRLAQTQAQTQAQAPSLERRTG